MAGRGDVGEARQRGELVLHRAEAHSSGSWANVGTYRTKGKKETRTINLPKGTYRAVGAGKFGYQTTVSGSGPVKK